MTIFPFTPSTAAVFSFSPTLDGQVYNATVPWLIFGSRYYLSLSSPGGDQIWYGGLVGSPSGFSIASLAWANGIVAAQTVVPHGYKVATTVELTIDGCAPAAYDGLYPCLITGPSSFSYMLASNPGIASVLGTAAFNINLIGGVPNASGAPFSSTLVFRESSQQFEASP